jgi:hypothetical protein
MRAMSLIVIAYSLAMGAGEAAAGDACAEFTCTGPDGRKVTIQGGGSVVVLNEGGNYSVGGSGFVFQQCKCTNQVHTPQPDEIAAVLSAEVAKAIDAAVDRAIKAMHDEHTKRIEKIYETFAEERKKTDEQIRLLTEMVRKLGGTPPARPRPAPATPPAATGPSR